MRSLIVGVVLVSVAPPRALAAPPATKVAALRRTIEHHVDKGPTHRLSKAELASPEFEDNLVRACTAVGIKLRE
jgi:hypothetical protein